MKKKLYILFVDWHSGEVCHRFTDYEWDFMEKSEKRAFTSDAQFKIKWEYK